MAEHKHITSVANLPRKFENDALELRHGSDIVKLSKCVSFISGTGVGFEPDDQYIHLHEEGGSLKTDLHPEHHYRCAHLHRFSCPARLCPQRHLNFELKNQCSKSQKPENLVWSYYTHFALFSLRRREEQQSFKTMRLAHLFPFFRNQSSTRALTSVFTHSERIGQI